MTTINLAPAPYVLIHLAASITGLSEKAIRNKIQDGTWLEDREYRRGPDGHIYISISGVTKWVEGESTSGTGQSASRSRSTASRSAALSKPDWIRVEDALPPPQKPTAYVLHKALFNGSPYFTTALVEDAHYLLNNGYDIHQYLYVGAEPTPQPPEGIK